MSILKFWILPFSILLSVSASAQDTLCSNVDECKSLLVKVKIRLAELSKTAVYLRANSAQFKRMEKETVLGEAWRDSNYIVWGDVHNNGSQAFGYNFQGALDYCKSIGAKVPSAEDYIRLKIGMGGSHTNPKKMNDYKPQILPNLNVMYSVWTSTTKELANGKKEAIMFQGMMGRFDEKNVNYNEAGVRCIMSGSDYRKL